MNIALIGAPGSGKSKLALELAYTLREDKPDRPVAVVDGYVREVEKRALIAIGPISDYIGNMYVALERYAQERVTRAEAEITITCGTLIETAVYVAMHFVSLRTTLSEEEQAALGPEMNAVLRMLAVLYNDIFSYDLAFYLPPTNPDEDTVFIDHQLQAGLAGFKLVEVTPLANPDTQLDEVLEALASETPTV